MQYKQDPTYKVIIMRDLDGVGRETEVTLIMTWEGLLTNTYDLLYACDAETGEKVSITKRQLTDACCIADSIHWGLK